MNLSYQESESLIKQIQRETHHEKGSIQAVQQIIDTYAVDERAYILSIVWRIALVDDEVTFREGNYSAQ